MFLYDLYAKRLKIKEVLLFAGIFILTIIPYYIYLLVNGALEQYFVANWLLNMEIRDSEGHSTYVILLEIFSQNIITGMLYVIGAVMLIWSNNKRQFVLLSLLLPLTILSLYSNLRTHYFIMVIPTAAIVASYTIYWLCNSKVIKFILIIAAISSPVLMHHYGDIIRYGGFDNRYQTTQLAKIKYVLSITDADDKVYDGNIKFNLFREDIDYCWFCIVPNCCLNTYREITGHYEYDIYELISSHKPKVISTFNIDNLNDKSIKDHYRRSEKYDDLLIRIE